MQQAETRALEVPLGDGRAAVALGYGGGAAAAEREAWQDLRWEGVPGAVRHAVSAGVAAGFQMAAAAGPLCDEPLWGVAFEVCFNMDSAPSHHGMMFTRTEGVVHSTCCDWQIMTTRSSRPGPSGIDQLPWPAAMTAWYFCLTLIHEHPTLRQGALHCYLGLFVLMRETCCAPGGGAAEPA